MARTPAKRIYYTVNYHNEEDGIPFYCLNGYDGSLRKARKAIQQEKKKHPDAFVVRVTEERMREDD